MRIVTGDELRRHGCDFIIAKSIEQLHGLSAFVLFDIGFLEVAYAFLVQALLKSKGHDQKNLMEVMMSRIVRFLDWMNTSIANLTMWLILPLIGVMLFDVVMRYCFNSPTVWGLELSIMLFGTYMLYAGPAAILQKVQVGVDIFSSKWTSRTQAIVQCVTYFFTCTLFLSLIWTSLMYALDSWAMKEISTSAWGQPIYHWKMCIPIAFTLTFLQTLSEFLRNLYLACTGRELV